MLTPIVLIAGIAYWLTSRKLSIPHLVTLTAVPGVIGAESLFAEGLTSRSALVCVILSPVLLILGYYVANSLGKSSYPVERDLQPRTLSYSITHAIVYLGVVYYFIAGGIPIFSANVEVTRLSFTAGGLFGLPGRLYLFGLPLMVALTAAEARNAGRALIRYRPFQVALVFLVASRLLSGFKSGLLEVIEILLIVGILSRPGLRPTQAIRRAFIPVAVAIVFAFAVGGAYATYEASGNPTTAFLHRLTVGQAASSTIVFDHVVPPLADGSHSVVQNDFRYYISEYFHVGIGAPYTFGQDVSAALVHTTPYAPFLSPVTTGSFADLYYQFGMLGAIVMQLIVGAILFVSTRFGIRQCRSPIMYALAFALVELEFGYVTKGDIAYSLTNWISVALLIAALAGAETVLRNGRASVQARRSGRNYCPDEDSLSKPHRLGLGKTTPASLS